MLELAETVIRAVGARDIEPVLAADRAEGASVELDISRARQAFNYAPVWELEAGIKHMLRHWDSGSFPGTVS